MTVPGEVIGVEPRSIWGVRLKRTGRIAPLNAASASAARAQQPVPPAKTTLLSVHMCTVEAAAPQCRKTAHW